MVRFEGALLCLMVMIIDLIAGILGIQAEIAQNKMKHVRVLIFECKEPSHQAFSLGLAAAGLLALAHVIASLLGGCVCICSQVELQRSSPNKKLSAASHVLSWIILAVGFVMLVIGAMSNSKSRRPCGISHHNFLSIGGVLCFFHGLICVAYYASANAARLEGEKSNAIGRPGGAQMTGMPHNAPHP